MARGCAVNISLRVSVYALLFDYLINGVYKLAEFELKRTTQKRCLPETNP